jgi:hypothetical protein
MQSFPSKLKLAVPWPSHRETSDFTLSYPEKVACRVGWAVAHPSPSPDPDERISRIRLFRRCDSGPRVAPTFRNPGDMVSNVTALGLGPS